MTVDQFVNKYNGVHIDEDGYYGAQCWDLVARYAREVVGCPSFPTGSGGAEGLYRIFANPIPQYFDRIANDKNNPNQLPNKGDIIVWDSTFSPPWGHTALVLSANSSGVTVLEQNGNNPGGVSYKTTRGWSKVSGWLRPKNGGSSEVIIGSDRGWYDRMNRFHHQLVMNADLSDVVFKAVQGKELSKILIEWSDHSNAQRLISYQEIGELASRDNWQKQIYDLQDWVKQRDTVINQNNQDLIALRQQIADFGDRPTKQQLEEIQKSVAEFERKAMEAQAELEKYKLKDAEDEKEAVNWLTALWRIITRKDS